MSECKSVLVDLEVSSTDFPDGIKSSYTKIAEPANSNSMTEVVPVYSLDT